MEPIRVREWLRPATMFLAAFGFGGLMLLAADLYAHSKQAQSVGLNVEAYRGRLLSPKKVGETRLAVIGGSPAFGLGVEAKDTLPARLEPLLQQRLGRPVSVVNIAFNGDSVVCFQETLDHYAYLDFAAVMVYSGINDLPVPAYDRDPSTCARNQSRVFKAVGYLPILPQVALEKYYLVRYGSIDRGYEENQSLSFRVAGTSSRTQPIFRFDGPPVPQPVSSAQSNLTEDQLIARYVERIRAVVATELSRGVSVYVVSEPYVSDFHRRQQETLMAGLQSFNSSGRFFYDNPGADFDVENPKLFFDQAHLTALGNQIFAERLADSLGASLALNATAQPAASNHPKTIYAALDRFYSFMASTRARIVQSIRHAV